MRFQELMGRNSYLIEGKLVNSGLNSVKVATGVYCSFAATTATTATTASTVPVDFNR